MKKLRRQRRSGETLVEVMVCAVLFLMMVAVMQGAISFGTSALHKSAQIRETSARICRNLRSQSAESIGETKSCSFKASSADGSKEGAEVLFTIGVPLGKKTAEYTDAQGSSQTADFYVYGPVAVETAGGAGGEDP